MSNDVDLQKKVIDALSFEPSIHSENIGVSVKNGIVTLTNAVNSWSEKKLVEETVKKVVGVRGIADELAIDIPVFHQRNDTDIAEASVKHLEWNIMVPHRDVKVTVEKGIVTLTGTVSWAYQRAAAERSLQNITGIKLIINNIEIKSQISPKEVKNSIEKALGRTMEEETNKINIEAKDSKVVLSGRVRSWLIREEAENAAWSVPGVVKVENNLSIF